MLWDMVWPMVEAIDVHSWFSLHDLSASSSSARKCDACGVLGVKILTPGVLNGKTLTTGDCHAGKGEEDEGSGYKDAEQRGFVCSACAQDIHSGKSIRFMWDMPFCSNMCRIAYLQSNSPPGIHGEYARLYDNEMRRMDARRLARLAEEPALGGDAQRAQRGDGPERACLEQAAPTRQESGARHESRPPTTHTPESK